MERLRTVALLFLYYGLFFNSRNKGYVSRDVTVSLQSSTRRILLNHILTRDIFVIIIFLSFKSTCSYLWFEKSQNTNNHCNLKVSSHTLGVWFCLCKKWNSMELRSICTIRNAPKHLWYLSTARQQSRSTIVFHLCNLLILFRV